MISNLFSGCKDNYSFYLLSIKRLNRNFPSSPVVRFYYDFLWYLRMGYWSDRSLPAGYAKEQRTVLVVWGQGNIWSHSFAWQKKKWDLLLHSEKWYSPALANCIYLVIERLCIYFAAHTDWAGMNYMSADHVYVLRNDISEKYGIHTNLFVPSVPGGWRIK